MPRPNSKKNKPVTVQFTEKEHAVLSAYSSERDWSMSQTVRNLIKDHLEDLGGIYNEQERK